MPTKDELKAQVLALRTQLEDASRNAYHWSSELANLEEHYEIQSEKFGELNEEYERILGQLRWTHTMLAITIEEQGGVVEVARSVAETYDGNLKTIKMYDLEEQGIVRVEVTDTEGIEPIEGEIVE